MDAARRLAEVRIEAGAEAYMEAVGHMVAVMATLSPGLGLAEWPARILSAAQTRAWRTQQAHLDIWAHAMKATADVFTEEGVYQGRAVARGNRALHRASCLSRSHQLRRPPQIAAHWRAGRKSGKRQLWRQRQTSGWHPAALKKATQRFPLSPRDLLTLLGVQVRRTTPPVTSRLRMKPSAAASTRIDQGLRVPASVWANF